MPSGEPRSWAWTNTNEYKEMLASIVPDEAEQDFVSWVISDTILDDPIEGSSPLYDDPNDPHYDPDMRHFGIDAPGHGIPAIVVFFRVERLPTDEDAGELTGCEVWTLADVQMGFHLKI